MLPGDFAEKLLQENRELVVKFCANQTTNTELFKEIWGLYPNENKDIFTPHRVGEAIAFTYAEDAAKKELEK